MKMRTTNKFFFFLCTPESNVELYEPEDVGVHMGTCPHPGLECETIWPPSETTDPAMPLNPGTQKATLHMVPDCNKTGLAA